MYCGYGHNGDLEPPKCETNKHDNNSSNAVEYYHNGNDNDKNNDNDITH